MGCHSVRRRTQCLRSPIRAMSNCIHNIHVLSVLLYRYVVSEIIKNFYAYNKDPKEYLFYYRDIDQKEIDLIYVNAGDIYPIEVKKGVAPTKPTKNFDVLGKYKLNIKPGLIIDSCEKIRPINEKAYTFPIYLL